jgi:serine protease Do
MILPRPARPIVGLALGLAVVALPAAAEDPFLRRTAAVRVVEQVGPSVVNITTTTVQSGAAPFQFGGGPMFDRFFRDFFEPHRQRQAQSLGSGVVIDDQGHVLTNEHVVSRAAQIRVTLADGREFDATLVGADANNDLAVLKLEGASDVPWTEPGTSADLMVGEPVIAIGNPFGLSNSDTTGVVSAINRSLRSDDRVFHGFLQTDASINPGNSGGPLLDATGELVGINTAIYQDAQGIGFAIPIDVTRRVIHELITKGEVAPVWLGLDLQDLDGRLVELMKLPDRLSGALVSRVRKGSGGASAGLRRGDIVLEVDDAPMHSARDYYDYLERSTVGQELRIELWRDGKTRTLAARTQEIPGEAITGLGEELLGLRLEPVEEGGYRVTSVQPGSGAANVGFEPGDHILGVNGLGLDGPEALKRAVLDLRGRHRALVVVVRGRGRYHVTVPLS